MKCKLQAPLGFMLTKDIDGDSEEQIKDFCVGMSDDEDFKKEIAEITHHERIKFLIDNGFEFEEVEELTDKK